MWIVWSRHTAGDTAPWPQVCSASPGPGHSGGQPGTRGPGDHSYDGHTGHYPHLVTLVDHGLHWHSMAGVGGDVMALHLRVVSSSSLSMASTDHLILRMPGTESIGQQHSLQYAHWTPPGPPPAPLPPGSAIITPDVVIIMVTADLVLW